MAPYFDWTCKKCGHLWEQMISKNERAKCPSCGSTRAEKEFPSPKIGNMFKKAWDRQAPSNPTKVYIRR